SSGKSSIVASHDGGKTFDNPPLFPPTAEILLTVEIAKSNSQVIYATSVPSIGNNPVLSVSQDRGANWTSKPITGQAASTQPRIIAIAPQDATVAYLRVTGAQSDWSVL